MTTDRYDFDLLATEASLDQMMATAPYREIGKLTHKVKRLEADADVMRGLITDLKGVVVELSELVETLRDGR